MRTYPHGVTSWVDTEQPDTDAAREFYGGLFGWTFEDAAPGRYFVAQLGGRDVAAIAPPAHEQPVDWNTYVAVGWVAPAGDAPDHWHVTRRARR